MTASYLSTVGVKPALGRVFSDDEDRPGGPAVALVGHELWQRRLGGDRGVLGRSLNLEGRTYSIVGVLPPDAMIEFPWMAIRPECKVQTSRMGSNQFRTDIPNYLEFYRQGRLDLDGMISRRGRLEDINDAFRAMKAGEVARTVLMFD